MSLFKHSIILSLVLLVSACGFSPVYGTGGNGTKLQNTIEVEEPKRRNAFLLTRRFEERLGRATVPNYKLTLNIDTREESLAVEREGDIARFNLIGSAKYALIDQATGQVATSGKVDNFTSYSTLGTTVATLAAERDAQERLMIILADMIIMRLLSADLS